MDLTLEVENYKLNIRAATMIVHNNRVLIHNNAEDKHCCLPGGRVAIGESSKETIEREVQEEIGKKIEVLDYVATIENFFVDSEGWNFHEIMFVYRSEFASEDDKKIDYTLKNIEGQDYLTYEWVDIDRIDEINLLPVALKEIIKEGKYPIHKINIDRK